MNAPYKAVLALGLLCAQLPSGLAHQQVQPQAVAKLPPPSLRYAILVGVEKYTDVNIPPLSGPANDVIQMEKSLEDHAGFLEGNIFLFATGGAADNIPTRPNILVALSRIKNMVPKDGLLLFMFSGHGVTKGDKAYLLPSDAVQTDDPEILYDTALPVDLIRKKIAATGVKQAIVLLDACRNGLESSKGEGDNPLTLPFQSELDFAALNKDIEASAVVYATALGSRAWIDNDKHLGYFTEAITDGLNGKAPRNVNGEITLAGLLDYVQIAVPQMVARDFGSSREQRPFFELSGYKASDLVIASLKIRTPASEEESYPTLQVKVNPRIPIPLNVLVIDFEALYEQYVDDEISLLNMGLAAFSRANYEWTIKCLERARAISRSEIDFSHHGVWTYAYPYLAAAYLFGQNDETKFKATLEEMLSVMHTPNSGLDTVIAIRKAVSHLETIRALMPPSDAEYVEKAIEQATTYAASFIDFTPGMIVTVCSFFGQARPGGPAYQKKETCIIPFRDKVDTQYRQTDDLDTFSGGGAKSPITSSDIPPGFHIQGMGTGTWSLQGASLDSDTLSIITSCLPSPDLRHGTACQVKTIVTVHYRK
jgi:hypothetical protein